MILKFLFYTSLVRRPLVQIKYADPFSWDVYIVAACFFYT
jgi:hypothetical protein